MTLPEKLHTLTRAAINNGWNIGVGHQVSSGGAPFVIFRAKRDTRDIHACWATAKTGTYRWDGAVVDNRHSGVAYSRVLDIIQEA